MNHEILIEQKLCVTHINFLHGLHIKKHITDYF
jgi:hypothetical protein